MRVEAFWLCAPSLSRRTRVRLRYRIVPVDLTYQLEIFRRSLASVVRPDGSVALDPSDVILLLDLLEQVVDLVRTADDLRRRLHALVNDPTGRVVAVPLREVAALLRNS